MHTITIPIDITHVYMQVLMRARRPERAANTIILLLPGTIVIIHILIGI